MYRSKSVALLVSIILFLPLVDAGCENLLAHIETVRKCGSYS